ncbi:MAG: EexN family lipoprotein [Steroidobacteraceae bacterium]
MRRRQGIKCSVIVFAMVVAGCSPDWARYTVDEYRADAKLRQSRIERCKVDPGTLAKTPDCINARQAAVLEDRVQLRDLPPAGLNEESSKSPDKDSKRTEDADEPSAPAR